MDIESVSKSCKHVQCLSCVHTGQNRSAPAHCFIDHPYNTRSCIHIMDRQRPAQIKSIQGDIYKLTWLCYSADIAFQSHLIHVRRNLYIFFDIEYTLFHNKFLSITMSAASYRLLDLARRFVRRIR